MNREEKNISSTSHSNQIIYAGGCLRGKIPGKEIVMKNTFNFNFDNINITVDGTPINIDGLNLNIESETSVQELATSANFIRDLIDQIKGLINAATAPTPTETKTIIKRVEAPIESPTPTPTDLDKIWRDLMTTAPKDAECGLSTIALKKDGVRIDASIEEDVINVHLWVREDVVHGHIYADHASWSGTPTRMYSGLLDCAIKDTDEETTEYIKTILKLNPAWTGLKIKR